MSIPNSKNFCGGNFQDWLEVNLIEKCNAKCSWCIERNGYHPEHHATVEELIDAILKTGKTNIILLGGEPLLYREIRKLIYELTNKNKRVWITTNGFLLKAGYIIRNLVGVYGVNISIHHYDLNRNKDITGVLINESNLIFAIKVLHNMGANVRMNCNTISGQIDTPEKIVEYVKWAKRIGADKVRFAELKQDDEGFVDLAEILDHKYGLNDNPFKYGCNSDCVIEGVPVNFRQMCGLQTSRRIKPENPEQVLKEVLYYDGKIYNGWQTIEKGENTMKENKDLKLIKAITNNKLTEYELENLLLLIERMAEAKALRTTVVETPRTVSGSGCCY